MNKQKLLVEKQIDKIRKESKMCKFFKYLKRLEDIRMRAMEKAGRGWW